MTTEQKVSAFDKAAEIAKAATKDITDPKRQGGTYQLILQSCLEMARYVENVERENKETK